MNTDEPRYADLMDLAHARTQRNLANEMFNTGPELWMTAIVLQRAKYRGHPDHCPACQEKLTERNHIVDRGRHRTLRCEKCMAKRAVA